MSNGFADVDNAQLTPPLKKYYAYSRLGDSRRRECTVADDDAPFRALRIGIDSSTGSSNEFRDPGISVVILGLSRVYLSR